MNRKILLFIICTLAIFQIAKSQNNSSSPIENIDSLRFKYFDIQFTKKQKKRLKEKKLNLVYLVDSLGTPSLIQTIGIKNKSILDSLTKRTTYFSKFKPRKLNGLRVQSVYELELNFPKYYGGGKEITFAKLIKYNESSIGDFEYIKESNERIDLAFTPILSLYTGNFSRHINDLGYGFKIHFTYTFKNSMMLGFNLSQNLIKLNESFPLEEERIQNPHPSIGETGISFGKWIKKNKIHILAEVNYFEVELSTKQPDLSPNTISLNGFSLGLVASYSIDFLKPRPIYMENDPSLLGSAVNIHLAFRSNFTNDPIGKASIFELGMGYKFGIKKVQEYKFK